MLGKKEYIKRSILDRRSSLDRRVLSFDPVYPDREQRINKDRRQHWEDRIKWQSADQWDSFSKFIDLKSLEIPGWK
jgi:hypothetical protein